MNYLKSEKGLKYFNGKDCEGKMEWSSLLNSSGYSGKSIYDRNIAKDFLSRFLREWAVAFNWQLPANAV